MSAKSMADNSIDVGPRPHEPHAFTVSALLFCSGFAGLVYQVLWMKQLGLLFGNTAQAASVTLSAFFAGLAAGSGLLGRRAGKMRNPLRLYAGLELGIALTALVYYAILALFYLVYPHVYRSVSSAAPMMIVKFGLSMLLVFPPAFCMGGTLPAIGQFLVRTPATFGRISARVYAVNTLGAAAGVVGATFLLVPWLGFRWSYAVAVLVSAAVGGVAWRLSAMAPVEPPPPVAAAAPARPARGGKRDDTHNGRGDGDGVAPPASRRLVASFCFLSGFGMLALEVLWTRMFAQVHANSVYAFAVILAVVLACLAGGAWISARLARLNRPPLLTLGVLVMLGAATLVFGPILFMNVTNGMQAMSSLEPWSRYMARLFLMGFGGIGIVVLALGTLFPFLMKAAEPRGTEPGRVLGGLMAVNTAGAIAGSLLCGFVLLPVFGMWRTMQLITLLYVVAGLVIPYGWGAAGISCRMTGVVLLLLLFTGLDPTRLPVSAVHPAQEPSAVLETWETSDCQVTVTENARGIRAIKINSAYVLGSTGAFADQANQTRVPLCIYPDTKTVFYLGLGTGISAGAALDPRYSKAERIVSCELVGEVVDAAKKYMPRELTRGIFSDPRSTVLIEDGRHHLMATRDRYDMINADLFLPYRRGAGSLYSLDHYRAARRRLTPGGVYVQWVPLFQVTDLEFGIITRTMLEAFSQVTLWRNNFTPGHEIVALVGHERAIPIPSSAPAGRADMLGAIRDLDWQTVQPGMAMPAVETIPFFYGGNVTAAGELFADYPVNTDDRPLVEYKTPRTFRLYGDRQIIWFVGPRIADLTRQIFARCPPASDPMLQARSEANRHLALAGAAFHRALVYKAMRQPEKVHAEWDAFIREWQLAVE